MDRRRVLNAGVWLAVAFFLLGAPLENLRSGYQVHDLAETVYHARELSLGRIPYRDIYSHHFLGYLLPFWLLDITTGITAESLFALQVCMQLIMTVAISRAARALTGSKDAGLLALLAGVTVGWVPVFGGLLFNYQSYEIPLVAGLFALTVSLTETVSKKRLALASLLFGLMISFDQRLGLFGLLFLPLLPRIGFRDTLLCGALPGLALLAMPLLALCALGAGHDVIEQTIIFPFFRRNATMSTSMWQTGCDLLTEALRVEPAVWLGGLGILLLLAAKSITAEKRILVLLLATASIGYVFAGGRYFPNYLVILTPSVVLGIASIPFAFSLGEQGLVQRGAALSLSALLIVYGAKTLKQGSLAEPAHTLGALAHMVSKSSQPNDDLLVWGYCPQLYVYSNRFTTFRDMGLITFAASLFHQAPLGKSNAVPEMLESFRAYIEHTPPRTVVMVATRSAHWTTGSGCIYASKEDERALGLGFFREKVDSEYDEVGFAIDAESTIGVYRRRAP